MSSEPEVYIGTPEGVVPLVEYLQRNYAEKAVYWNEIREAHLKEVARLSHCGAISLTSCQCGYLQRIRQLAIRARQEEQANG